jgi:hypothetical protein
LLGELSEGRLCLCGSCGRGVLWFGTAKPTRLPEDAAISLATTVAGSVAPQIAEQHGVWHFEAAAEMHRVADAVSAVLDDEALSAKLEHLRHERQPVHSAPSVKSGQDLSRTLHLDKLTATKGSWHYGLRWLARSRTCVAGKV